MCKCQKENVNTEKLFTDIMDNLENRNSGKSKYVYVQGGDKFKILNFITVFQTGATCA